MGPPKPSLLSMEKGLQLSYENISSENLDPERKNVPDGPLHTSTANHKPRQPPSNRNSVDAPLSDNNVNRSGGDMKPKARSVGRNLLGIQASSSPITPRYSKS